MGASDDWERVIGQSMEEREQIATNLRKIFKSADSDGNGNLTWAELRRQMADPQVVAYLKTLELEEWDVHTFFSMLKSWDARDEPSVDIDSFVSGCLRLKGLAKNIDVVAFRHDQARCHLKMERLVKQMRDECS